MSGGVLVRGLALVAALLPALSLSEARAHLTRSAQTTTRLVEVSAHGGRVELSYVIAFGELPAAGERRRMDLDHDGLVSGAEQAAWRERMAGRLRGDLLVQLDGLPLALTLEGRLEMADNRLGDLAFLVEYTARIPLGAGAHTLELDDRLALPLPGEHEILFKEGPGGRFVSSARGAAAAADERQLRFDGPRRSDMEERRVAFRFSVEAGPPEQRGPVAAREPARWGAGRVLLLAGVVVALSAVLLLLARRLRRP